MHHNLLIILLLSFGLIPAGVAEQPRRPERVLTVAYGADNIPDYEAFLGGVPVEDIYYYNGQKARRDVIDGVLFVQALRLGGITDKVEFAAIGTYKRILHSIASGQVVSGAQTNWGQDTLNQSSLLNTQPLVREGEFVVGIYTSPDNAKALKAKSVEDIQQLSAVSNKHWRNDWKYLKQLDIKPLYNAIYWEQMVKMVASQRADFTLAPFQPSHNFQLYFDRLVLVPIPNLKVALPGTRHWSVSRKHPDGIRVHQALEKGLQVLRSEGRITRAYTESGFFTAEVASWSQLTAPQKFTLQR